MSQPQGPRGRAVAGASTATRGLIVVGAAVLIGLMLLLVGGTEDSTASGDGAVPLEDAPIEPVGGGVDTTQPSIPPATATPVAQLKVLCLNASGTTGTARACTDKLKAIGYTSAPKPDNATKVDDTRIYFVPGSEGDAQAVAAVLGFEATRVQAMPDPPPVKLGEVTVIVLIGADGVSASVTTTTGT